MSIERPPKPGITPDRKAVIDMHIKNGLSQDVRNSYAAITGAVETGMIDLLAHPGFSQIDDYSTYLSGVYAPVEKQYIMQQSDPARIAEYDRLASIANTELNSYRHDPNNEEQRQRLLAVLKALDTLFK